MALIDLSKFQPNVLQDNRQRQEFGGEGLNAQGRALERLGQVATSAVIDATDRERRATLSAYQNESSNYMLEEEAKFESKWNELSSQGKFEDENKKTYMMAKQDFYAGLEKELKNKSKGDEGKFGSFELRYKEIVSRSKIGSIASATEYGKKATDVNFAKSTEEAAKKIVIMNPNDVADYYQTYLLPELENNYNAGAQISPSHALQSLEKSKTLVSKTYKEKLLSMEFPVGAVPAEILKDTMPLSVWFSPEAKAFRVERISGELAGNKEENIFAMRAVVNNGEKVLQLAQQNLLKQKARGAITEEEFKILSAKIDSGLGKVSKATTLIEEGDVAKLNLEEIDVGGILSYDEAKKLDLAGKTSYEIFGSMSPNDRIELISTLEKKMKDNSRERSSFVKNRVEDLKKVAMDLGANGSITSFGLSRVSFAPNEIIELRKQNPDIYTGSDAAQDAYNASVNKLYWDAMRNPSLATVRGEKIIENTHNSAMKFLLENGDAEVIAAASQPEFGAKARVQASSEYKRVFRNATNAYNKDRAQWAVQYASLDTVSRFRKAFTPNGISPSGMQELTKYLSSMDNVMLMPQNKNKLQEQLATSILGSLDSEIKAREARGEDTLSAWRGVFNQMPPELKSFTLEQARGMNKDKVISTAFTVEALSSRLSGTELDLIVSANEPRSQVEIVEEMKRNPTFKSGVDSVKQEVSKQLDEIYKTEGVKKFGFRMGRDDASPRGGSRSAIESTFISAVAQELKNNPNLDIKEATSVLLKRAYSNTIIPNNPNIFKGMFKKLPDEDGVTFTSKLDKKYTKIMTDIQTGQIKPNLDYLPLSEKDRQIIKGFKTQRAMSFLMEKGFKIRLQSPDDFGLGRKFNVMIEDEKTKALYPMKDDKGYNVTGEVD